MPEAKRNDTQKLTSVSDYVKTLKAGDRVVFGGHGVMDGMKGPWVKQDTYRVVGLDDDGDLVLTPYRGRNRQVLPAVNFNQEMALLSASHFKNLKSAY
jgi:hypothetical protein